MDVNPFNELCQKYRKCMITFILQRALTTLIVPLSLDLLKREKKLFALLKQHQPNMPILKPQREIVGSQYLFVITECKQCLVRPK